MELIPDWGKNLAFLAKLIIFVFIIRDIGSFSKKIAELLILPFQISKTQRAKYNINIQDSKIEDSGISIGDIVRSSFKQERQKDEK
ncbi:MAG: hypothetical protein F6K18_06535 [Okeania sp. SIO2C2]|uniref:hypothetical protein n=1 Tax=Okeania sp. SIO2C2 TaxID=2607787 RepID=UPI0013BA797C|nr:hypothetical protein [Okeania sp. SIO2C2]NEP86511.1 hypothetical protein [Okeania sp. SIO2C2]